MFNLDQHNEVHQQQKSDDDKMHRQVMVFYLFLLNNTKNYFMFSVDQYRMRFINSKKATVTERTGK